MEELIKKITLLKAEIKSFKQYKDAKVKRDSLTEHKKRQGELKDIQGQIDHAMAIGMDEHGNIPSEPVQKPKMSQERKLKLIKALELAGYRESALQLKNWDSLDGQAKKMAEEIKEDGR